MSGYTAEQMKRNRASMLVQGGSEPERRAFVVATAQALAGEPFLEAKDPAQVLRSLHGSRGTVYIPDVTTLPEATQREVVRVLREKEERPRLALGVPTTVDGAHEKGLLTDDLKYWLRTATIDLRKKGR